MPGLTACGALLPLSEPHPRQLFYQETCQTPCPAPPPMTLCTLLHFLMVPLHCPQAEDRPQQGLRLTHQVQTWPKEEAWEMYRMVEWHQSPHGSLIAHPTHRSWFQVQHCPPFLSLPQPLQGKITSVINPKLPEMMEYLQTHLHSSLQGSE